jgi:hypothetical protein
MSKEQSEAKEQIVFAGEFFNGNPECLELKELINQAQVAYDNKQYGKAISLSDAAIQSCKNLLATQGKIPKTTKKETEATDLFILGIETLIFLIISYSFYNYYKRRRFKQQLKK